MIIADIEKPGHTPVGRGLHLRANREYRMLFSRAPEDTEWDAFLTRASGGYYAQSSSWGRVKTTLGWRAARILVYRGGSIAGGAQLLIRPLPVGGAVGYVPRGPVVAADDPSLRELILRGLHRLAGGHRLQYLIVQPPLNGEVWCRSLIASGFRPSPVRPADTATVLIDLTEDLDAVMARMKEQTRKNIRRGLRRGVTVREGTEADISTFHNLISATGRRQGFVPYPELHLAEMWRILGPEGRLRLFIAEYEGEAVSAQLVLPFGDTAYFAKIGWSGRYAGNKPNETLEWESIRWAKLAGYKYCDLEGIDQAAADSILRHTPLPEHVKQTATHFKLGFGGRVAVSPGAYDYVYNPPLRWVYHKVYPKVAGWRVLGKMQETIRRGADGLQ